MRWTQSISITATLAVRRDKKRDAQHASLHCHDYTPGRGSSLNSPRLPQACYRRPLRRGVGSGAGFLFSAHCFAHRNLGEHQRATLYCRQQRFSCDLPLWLFVFRSRQCLDIFARIAQGPEHQAIRRSNWNMETRSLAPCSSPTQSRASGCLLHDLEAIGFQFPHYHVG